MAESPDTQAGSPETTQFPPGTIEEPQVPGTSAKLHGGKPFWTYIGFYGLGALGIFAIWGGVGGILLPNQVQLIELPHYFSGADAGVDLAALSDLKNQVDAGQATPTAEQERLLGLLRAYEGARAAGLGLITAIGVAITMFIQPVAGVLSDRTRTPWGRRAPWVLGGTLVGALALIGLRYSNTILLMVVFWSVAQLIINMAQGPLTATVADRVPPDRLGTASGISGMGLMVGATLGTVVAGILFGSMGLDAYYPFIIVLALGGLLFVAFQPDRSSKALEVDRLDLKQFLLSFVMPLRNADFRWVFLAKLVFMFGYAVSTAFSIFMLQGYIQPALTAAEATATAPMIQLLGFPFTLVAMAVSGKWSDAIGRRKPFVFWASVLFAVSFCVPLVWPALPAMFIQAVLAAIGMGTWVVVDQALFIDVIPDKRTVGRDLGVGALGGNLGQALGPVVAAQVVVLTGGYFMVWVVAIIIVLVAAAAILPVKAAK